MAALAWALWTIYGVTIHSLPQKHPHVQTNTQMCTLGLVGSTKLHYNATTIAALFHSFLFILRFILVMVSVDPEPVLGTLCKRQEPT